MPAANVFLASSLSSTPENFRCHAVAELQLDLRGETLLEISAAGANRVQFVMGIGGSSKRANRQTVRVPIVVVFRDIPIPFLADNVNGQITVTNIQKAK